MTDEERIDGREVAPLDEGGSDDRLSDEAREKIEAAKRERDERDSDSGSDQG